MEGVIELLGRRLRLGIVGGGPGSFIGGMHRIAARLDDQYEILAGVVSSNPEKSLALGMELGFSRERCYKTVEEMINAETKRSDGVEVIAIMTPNSTHFNYSMQALDNGFHVICDKPMTLTPKEAEALNKKVDETGLTFCLTHNYTGYPMVRQAKSMVMNGDLGEIRLIQVEYVQGGVADSSKGRDPSGPRGWKFNRDIAGPSLVLGDIGSHAHNLARFITGLEVSEIFSEVGAIVPERTFDDYAGALLRFSNGARGSFWVTQAAAGVENSLKIRISGEKGSLEWLQEIPQKLTFKPIDKPAVLYTPNCPGCYPLAINSSRIVKGHPEGFPEAFANLYRDAAHVIASKKSGKIPDPMAQYFPTSYDGLAGVKFIYAAIESSKCDCWIKI